MWEVRQAAAVRSQREQGRGHVVSQGEGVQSSVRPMAPPTTRLCLLTLVRWLFSTQHCRALGELIFQFLSLLGTRLPEGQMERSAAGEMRPRSPGSSQGRANKQLQQLRFISLHEPQMVFPY